MSVPRLAVTCEQVRAADLKPGDLFSTEGEGYWHHMDPMAVGERVYIRTHAPCPPAEADVVAFRITVATPGHSH